MRKSFIFIFIIFLAAISIYKFGDFRNSATQNETKAQSFSYNIPNGSLEQAKAGESKPENWSHSNWGENIAEFSYLTEGHAGRRSIQTTITAYTSGDAKWHHETQRALPGKKYTFSDYYKSNTESRVVVEFVSSNGDKNYAELKTAPSSSDWSFYQDSFETPSDVKVMTIFHLLSSVGFLITDDYKVTDYKPVGFNRALVSITFDDGWESQFASGDPVLRSAEIPATYYISTGLLNTPGYMTDRMVMSFRDSGNEIANHTVSHPRLLTLSDENVSREFLDSQNYLSARFGIVSYNFASPYGQTDERVQNIAGQYFKSHRGVNEGYNYRDNLDIYQLKVQNILVTTTEAEFRSWLNQAAREKSWLILVYHAVDNEGDEYRVKPDNFQKQINLVKQSGLHVVTIEQALSEVRSQLTN